MYIKRRFSIKPKDFEFICRLYRPPIRNTQKRADQSLSRAPLVRNTLVFECKFSTSSTPSLSNRPFLLASNCVFCFRCISLKQISNEFQLSLRLPLIERPIHWYRRALITGAKPVKLKYSFFILFFSYANHIWHYEFFKVLWIRISMLFLIFTYLKHIYQMFLHQ